MQIIEYKLLAIWMFTDENITGKQKQKLTT
ncbi:uncharacterized protein METZ01_LOCUS330916 [marine metagenome]|uniref:Uncharacterized protein n=1 Tax=marine metagenome TaxID=408172 RepID=A0A382Q0Z2_9ZZZZ